MLESDVRQYRCTTFGCRAESVCNRTDIGTTSTPWIRWQPGYGLASGTSRACHRCAGGVVATAMCSPSRVPDLGADPAASTRLLMLIQCCVWCQGWWAGPDVARVGEGVRGWTVWVALRLVWKVSVSWVSRCRVPMLW